MEKGKDVNLVWTNLRTGKNHSTERGDVPRKLYYNSAVSSTEALRIRTESTQNLHRSFTESAQIFCVEFVEFCKVSCDMYRIHDRKVPLTTAGLYLPPPPPSPQFRSYPVFPMHVWWKADSPIIACLHNLLDSVVWLSYSTKSRTCPVMNNTICTTCLCLCQCANDANVPQISKYISIVCVCVCACVSACASMRVCMHVCVIYSVSCKKLGWSHSNNVNSNILVDKYLLFEGIH